MSEKVKQICVNGIGIALFVVLSLCIQVPIFQNYYLCLGYVVMTVYCYSVGTTSGVIIGTLGVILYCILINGLRGMPGWAVGNLILGLLIGPVFKMIRKIKKTWIIYLIATPAIIIVTAISILGIKSIVECLLYAQPFFVRVAKNIYAFMADAFVIIVSLPICRYLDPKIKQIMKNI